MDYGATWCQPCMKNFPHTLALQKELGEKDFVLVTLSVDDPDSESEALRFLKKQASTGINLIANVGGGADAFEVFEIDGGIPFYQIHDRSGKLVKTIGPDGENPVSHDDVEKAVKALIAGE